MKLKILIIDDGQRWLDFINSELSEFEFISAMDSETAITQLNRASFYLVIVGSRYIDTIESIKAIFPEQRIVAVTVHPNTEEQLQAYRLGAMRYFAKSFSRKDLREKLLELDPTEMIA